MDVNQRHWDRFDVTIAGIELSDFRQSLQHFPYVIHIARMKGDEVTHLLRRHCLRPRDGNPANVILVARIDADRQVDCLDACTTSGARRRVVVGASTVASRYPAQTSIRFTIARVRSDSSDDRKTVCSTASYGRPQHRLRHRVDPFELYTDHLHVLF